MSLIARSRTARAVAAHILRYGTQTEDPPAGLSAEQYVRALGRLRKSGVLRRWAWEVDGKPYAPRSATSGWLWLPGSLWEQYEAEAAALGFVATPLEEADP